MRSFKMLSALVAVIALSALGAASASAAEFTSEGGGTLDGKALNTQEFHTNGGTVKCTGLDVHGTAAAASTSQHATVTYTGCTAFGVPADIAPLTYEFTAHGQVHLKNTVTIEVTIPLVADCYVHLEPSANQSLNGVTYIQNGNNIKVKANPVKGITYTTRGSGCGTGGSNGEYTGESEVTLTSGKKLTIHTP